MLSGDRNKLLNDNYFISFCHESGETSVKHIVNQNYIKNEALVSKVQSTFAFNQVYCREFENILTSI